MRLLRRGREDESARTTQAPHVLLVVDQFPKSLGGGERIVLKLAERLPAFGYRVSILTFAAHDESAGLQEPPCPIYLLPLQRTYDLDALRGAFAFGRFLRKERVSLVHTCFESSDLWAGAVTKLFSDAKLVWNRRDMGILRARKHAVAYRWLSRLPDAVFAVSEQVRRYSIETDGIAPERVTTIYNGLDLEKWPRLNRPPRVDREVIATLGNIRRVKGHDVLLRAFAMVHREFPWARLEIGGAVLETDTMQELRRFIADEGLGESVSFCGDVKDQQRFLRHAGTFVLPSRSEGFSNAIVEAMASSLPVVATDVGGNAEAVVDGVTGLIVASEDVEGLAAAMAEMLRNGDRAQQMGAEGRRRVEELFTTGVMLRAYAAVFDRLLLRKLES